MNYFKNLNDGTPYEGKLSRTVWSGGKSYDDFKGLPITISSSHSVCVFSVYSDGSNIYLEDTWNLAKQEPLHQHKDATAQFRNKSDFFGR